MICCKKKDVRMYGEQLAVKILTKNHVNLYLLYRRGILYGYRYGKFIF
jgi:hypothetical protein